MGAGSNATLELVFEGETVRRMQDDGWSGTWVNVSGTHAAGSSWGTLTVVAGSVQLPSCARQQAC